MDSGIDLSTGDTRHQKNNHRQSSNITEQSEEPIIYLNGVEGKPNEGFLKDRARLLS